MARKNDPARGFPRFFTRQLFAFLLLAGLVLFVDFVLLTTFVVQQGDRYLGDSRPSQVVLSVNDGLVSAGAAAEEQGVEGEDAASDSADEAGPGADASSAAEGAGTADAVAPIAEGAGAAEASTVAWSLSGEAARTLQDNDAWAFLLDEQGRVVWERGVPADVPRALSVNEVAMAAHYAMIEDYPVFFWDRDDGLLVVGFPRDSYWVASFTYAQGTIESVPKYIMIVFGIDMGILFLYMLISRQRTRRAVRPIAEALQGLAEGRPVDLNLSGDLRAVGVHVNEASAVIRAKDRARESWIRGVSHDIRTPLSLIAGYADALANTPDLPKRTRADAALIRAQSLKIKDLIFDLNTASRLEYDMQPIDVHPIAVSGLLREVSAEYLNGALPAGFDLDLNIAPAAHTACVLGDVRLLRRAVQNLVQNAVNHNPTGCSIDLSLDAVEGDGARIVRIAVSDDGAGASAADLAALRMKISLQGAPASAPASAGAAEDSFEVARPNAGSPPPPLGYAALETERRERAAEAVGARESHGLGLLLVSRIAAAHGGSVSVDSPEGSGFRVTIELPLA